ncbi:MAG TPA: class I SAM-dependent methyltransferase [Ktedonobacteraceae bacterium]|jgi:SAM-dependent methyltransferase
MIDEARAQFRAHLEAEYQQPFEGWDFSHLQGRKDDHIEELPWDYANIVKTHLRKTHSLLDLGTGGGEFLSSLQPLPPDTCATEGYTPNLLIARKRLEPLGIPVSYHYRDMELPFEDQRFDLVINRHESYRPSDVYRVLMPGGHFITQQVGGENELGLNQMLGTTKDSFRYLTLAYVTRELEEAGFQIIQQQEVFTPVRYHDIGIVVYYLKAVPWQVPDFSIDRYIDALWEMHQHIQHEGYIEVHYHRLLAVVRKP